MATSYRIKVNLNNKSAFTTPDAAMGMGATVIPASRGPMKPVKLGQGETERICQMFGADRYEVLEAIAYNNKYPLWISAPSCNGSTSVMLLTSEGLIPAAISITDIDALDFNALPLQITAGKGNGKKTSFSASVSKMLFPDMDSDTGIGLKEIGVVAGDTVSTIPLAWDITDPAAPKYTAALDDAPCGGTVSIDGGDIVIDMAFKDGHIPAKGESVSFRLVTDTSNLGGGVEVYAIIGMRFPCKDFLKAAVYKSDNEGCLMLNLNTIKNGNSYSRVGYPTEFSLTPGAVNAKGALIYGQELLRDDDFIFIKANPDCTMDWNTWMTDMDGTHTKEQKTKTLIAFTGGDRGAKCEGSVLTQGWEQFKEFKKYPADIYFDVTADPAIPAEFSSLRATIPYRRFLYPYPMQQKASEITQVPSVSDRGICAFWGAAYILNPYEKTGDLLSTLMGEVASRYADARVHSYGGRAVAWGDENQVGGQLSQGRVVKFLYDATEDEMQALDKLGINPIVLNEIFGPMVASRRTTDQSGSDYSYADYSMIVDYCLEKIVNEVLPYQLIKFNDDSHRRAVLSKTENILKPLTASPNNVIRDYAIKCDGENNGDDILEQQLFVLSVAIKVTPKSEYIQFNFINSAQGGSVEADVA